MEKYFDEPLPKVYKACNADIIDAIDSEVDRAKTKHPGNFHNAHEGYAVLLEEVDELWVEVKTNGSKARMREEAIQIAAMAIRFLQELT